MIRKLVKHDIKNMTKILVYFYAISIILAAITRLINLGNHIHIISIIGMIFAGFTYSAIANILINTFVHIIKVFICSFYKDESYLTHTLPVSKKQLLISKYISSLIVVLTSTFVCFLTLFILFYSNEFVQTIKAFIEMAVSGFNMPVWLFITLFVFIIFSQICSMMSMAFAAIIKGNSYNSKRILYGIIWFVIYYYITMMATALIVVITFAINGSLQFLIAQVMPQSAFITVLIVGLITDMLSAIIFYFVSKKLFEKGVNVD
jgi:hypothetical protein